MDVKPSTGKYTWNNKRIEPGHIAARLDCFLIQDTFLLLGLNLTSKILQFGGSDHKPILLEMVNDKNLGPIPFKFNPMWANHLEFLRIVTESCSPPVTGYPFFVWEEKVRQLKKDIKSWAKSIPSPNYTKTQVALALEIHQASMEDRTMDHINIQMEIKLHSDLHAA